MAWAEPEDGLELQTGYTGLGARVCGSIRDVGLHGVARPARCRIIDVGGNFFHLASGATLKSCT